MQNNKSKKFRSFVKEKGYYIVLLICAAAVGVSGYFILSGDREEEKTEPSDIRLEEMAPEKPTHSREESVMATEEVLATEELREPFSISWPVEGQMVTAFAADHLAYNATTKDWRTHEGVDLRAVVGQEVRAAAPGTVYTVYEDKNLGTTVVLRHPDGFTTHYSNLAEEVQVEAGQTVDIGTVLGTVGRTANAEAADEPHVHFSLYQNNVPLDPKDFVR